MWCEEAPAYELVPPERMRASYHLRRALLQGGISLGYNKDAKDPAGRLKIGLKSLSAILIYLIALPFASVAGWHKAMQLLVKSCHHIGRLSLLLGMPIMRERKF